MSSRFCAAKMIYFYFILQKKVVRMQYFPILHVAGIQLRFFVKCVRGSYMSSGKLRRTYVPTPVFPAGF